MFALKRFSRSAPPGTTILIQAACIAPTMKNPPVENAGGRKVERSPGLKAGSTASSGGALDVFWRERQGAATLAACGKNRVSDGRLNHRSARLAQTAGRAVALDEMNIQDLRIFIHARDAVHVEVSLFDAAILDGNFTPHTGRLPEIDGALHLRQRLVRMHQGTGVHHRRDFL